MRIRVAGLLAVWWLGACGDENHYAGLNGINASDIQQVALSIWEDDWEQAEEQVNYVLVQEPHHRQANILLIKILLHKADTSMVDLALTSFQKKGSGSDFALLQVMTQIDNLSEDDRLRLIEAVMRLRPTTEDVEASAKKNSMIAAYARIASIAALLKPAVLNSNGKFDKEKAKSLVTDNIAEKVTDGLEKVKDNLHSAGEKQKEFIVNSAVESLRGDDGKPTKDKLIEFLEKKSPS